MKQLLDNQRSKSKINPSALATVLYRGKERFDRIQDALAKVAQNEGGVDPRLYELSRDQLYTEVQRKSHKMRTEAYVVTTDPRFPMPEITSLTNFHLPGSIGVLMVTSILSIMADEDQYKDWYTRVRDSIIYAAYAQTELATGSDVQNLQTLAVYDPAAQDFEFHNPTIESIKWWPGELGLSANYAVVFARLLSNGKDHGVHPFMVQLRDLKTHALLPGVEVGDIGPKLGFNSKDNGFLRFTHHKAPRRSLLAKFISVSSDGTVQTKGNPRAMYTGMMDTRTSLIITAYSTLFKAVTIATRYSLFRTQFKDAKGNSIPIFNYQMQRDKLLREIAKAYTMNMAVECAQEQIDKNKVLSRQGDFSQLQNTHILLCCLKSLFTWWESDGYANLIKACGGHGYSQFSGIPALYTENFSHQILEGENSVLLLQATRYLIKCFARIQKGNSSKVVGYFAFLIDMDKHMETLVAEDENCTSVPSIISMFRRSTCFQVQRLGMKMFALQQEEKDAKKIWDTKVGVENLLVAKTFAAQLIMEVAWTATSKVQDPAIKKAISQLIELQAINLAEEHASALVLSGSLVQGHSEHFIKRKLDLIDLLSDDALVLAEGMQWPDAFLASAIGSSDKHPYETLYNWAKNMGQLNQFADQIHPSIPLYQQKVAKHREDQRL